MMIFSLSTIFFVSIILHVQIVYISSNSYTTLLSCNNKNSVYNIPSSSSSIKSTSASFTSLFSIRAGGEEDDSDYDLDFSEDDDEDDDEDGSDLDDLFSMDTSDTDFTEESTMDRMLVHWSKTPPLTKAYISSSILLTALGYMSKSGNEFPKYCTLDWKSTINKVQLWRPITAFLNFGPFGLGYIMTLQFVWTYMSTLERLNHKNPYDFWFMIVFGCTSMVIGYSVLKLPPSFLGHNLSTFLVYVWSRYHEGFEVNVMELFNTRAELLPWFFLAQTALFEGQLPTLDLLGIAFGHIYHHLKTVGVLKTPRFIVHWYHNSDGAVPTFVRGLYKEVSSDFEMQ